jgi:putative peptidoglycan lipid II flippase
MPNKSSVTKAAHTIGLAVLGSRLLGLAREMVVASLFGAAREFDAFITAFRIPNLLRDLFAEGALSAAFVPTLSKKLASEGDSSAWRLANLVLNALLVVVGLITVLGIVAAPWIVRLLAPGFSEIAGKTELTVTMTRIMFPFLLLIAVAALVMGILNAKRRFGIPASASMMFNIGSIGGGIFFAWLLAPTFLSDPKLAEPRSAERAMIAFSIGTIVGGAAQLAIQLPSLHKIGYRYALVFDWRDEGFRSVLRLLGPAVISVAAVQINVFVDQWFASLPQMSEFPRLLFEMGVQPPPPEIAPQGNGAVTWLNCAFRLMQFPIGIFGVALGVATLPTASQLAASGKTEEFRKTVARSIRIAFFWCIPAAVGLAVLAEPIISVIYQHGRFDAHATSQTAWCLRAFAVGLAGYAAIKVLAPTFYALGDSRTPMFVALGSVAVNVGLDYVFGIALGMKAAGLALATSCVALTNFVALFMCMRRKIQRFETSALMRSLAKIVASSAAMGAAALFAQRVIEANRYLELTASVSAALVIFVGSCWLLGVGELSELLKRFRSKKRQ